MLEKAFLLSFPERVGKVAPVGEYIEKFPYLSKIQM